MIYSVIDSPVGELLATGDGTSVTGIYTPGHGRHPEPAWVSHNEAFTELRRQLEEYFAGERTDFDLPVSASGTAFQEAVWKGLREIGYGQTESYGQLATRIGAPAAARAAGAAIGRNPISIVVPCHRVIGANGFLTGYAGGIDAKRWLLEHERAHAGARQPAVTRYK